MLSNRTNRLMPLLVTAIILLLPTAASANGAMSLALATFDLGPWIAYVVVTIVFEALAMGRWLQMPLASSLWCSLNANFITAVVGGVFSGPISILFGGYGGLNPNPLGRTLWVFTWFGIGSALIEAYVWRRKTGMFCMDATLPQAAEPAGWSTITLRCLVVHLIGVPLGLCVLLVPSRPYPGMDRQVNSARETTFRHYVPRALQAYIDEHHALPAASSYAEALRLIRPYMEYPEDGRDLWALAYTPDYHRFDTTERRRHPIEWNGALAGLKESDEPNPTWLIRSRFRGWPEGVVIEYGRSAKESHDSKELGFDTMPK